MCVCVCVCVCVSVCFLLCENWGFCAKYRTRSASAVCSLSLFDIGHFCMYREPTYNMIEFVVRHNRAYRFIKSTFVIV